MLAKLFMDNKLFLYKVAFSIYLGLLVYIVFFTPNRAFHEFREVQLVPLVSIIPRLIRGPWNEQSSFYSNFFGNILLFIPFGFLLKILLKNASNKKIVLIGTLASSFIELTQLLFDRGVCDINDVILNVLGTYVGVVIFALLIRSKRFQLSIQH